MKLAGEKSVLSQYLRVLENRRLSPETIKGYGYVLTLMARLLEKLCGVIELEEVTILHLREYVQYLMTQPIEHEKTYCPPKNGSTLAPVSVATHIRRVKTFFHWCYKEELIDKNPSDRLESPKVDEKIIDTFTEKQIEQMMGAFDLSTTQGFRDYVIILLMLDTGMRRSEVARLEVEGVHDAYISVFGKGRKERQVGLHPDISTLVWKYIHKYRNPANENELGLFLTVASGPYIGKSITSSGVHRVMQHLKKVTGIDEVRLSSHTFRHTFACMYLDEGGDLFSLSREMGHTDVKTTERYLKNFTSKNARKHHTGHSPINRIKLRSTRKTKEPDKKPGKK
jgi:integrase/recombinase XerD